MTDPSYEQTDRLYAISDSGVDHSRTSSVPRAGRIAFVPRIQGISRASIPALCGCVAVLAGAQSTAQEGEQVHRTLFYHHDQSEVPGKEIVSGTAILPAGTVIGWHVHSGDEAGYVLRGELVLKTRGQPDRKLKAGDHFFNPRGAVHSLLAPSGSTGGMAYSTWIVDKGKPLASEASVERQPTDR